MTTETYRCRYCSFEIKGQNTFDSLMDMHKHLVNEHMRIKYEIKERSEKEIISIGEITVKTI